MNCYYFSEWAIIMRQPSIVVAAAIAVLNALTIGMHSWASAIEEDYDSLLHKKHPLEDSQSWDLHLERERETRRKLKAASEPPMRTFRKLLPEIGFFDATRYPVTEDDEDIPDPYKLPFTVRHVKVKKHVPFAGGDTTHGIMIDAGSQGTRLHIYEWDKRFLLDEDDLIQQSNGMKLSYPTSNNRWTDKYTPGLDAFGSMHLVHPDRLEKAVGNYLGALLDFAREVLKDKEDEWHTYPIYLKATGGLRTLPQPDRVRLMKCVRKLFHNKAFNPFSFEDERARVISGEEEAIYGWVGVNFAKGRLIDSSKGSGIGKDPKRTYGMLEMGGASTQIANFENHGDLMANLFKLQLGGARHWNVYVHSYLYFGINGAWSRLNALLYGEGKTVNPCLPLGSSVDFDSWIHSNEDGQFYPRSDPKSTPFSVTMVNNKTSFDFEECSNRTNLLLRKKTNKEWCDFQMDGNCGFAGIYQPPMPKVSTDVDKFIATSNFVDVFRFLDLGETARVSEIGKAAEAICKLDWKDLKAYDSRARRKGNSDLELAQYCFRSVFVYNLLRHGWEFGEDYELTAIDVIDGRKLGWALGCMLYEINTLPWQFHPELLYKGPSWFHVGIFIVLGTLVGSFVGLMVAMRVSKSFNKSVEDSSFFQNHPGFANNLVVRKTLSLPDYGLGVDELDRLYKDNQNEENRNRDSSPSSTSSSGTKERATERMPLSSWNTNYSAA